MDVLFGWPVTVSSFILIDLPKSLGGDEASEDDDQKCEDGKEPHVVAADYDVRVG